MVYIWTDHLSLSTGQKTRDHLAFMHLFLNLHSKTIFVAPFKCFLELLTLLWFLYGPHFSMITYIHSFVQKNFFNSSNIYLAPSMEKAMAPHSSTLAWKIPWTEEPRRLQSVGSLRVGYNWATSLSLFTFMHWRRKWQPTQCSCLENPRDGGAWWAAVYGVAQSWTRLKWLSSSKQLSMHAC